MLTGHGAPRALLGVAASADLFTLLDVPAAHGRTFDRHDLGADCVTVLAHRFWQTLGADPRIVGQALRLNDQSCTVVGVMPSTFVFFPEPTELWRLITRSSAIARNPAQAGVAVFGRLAPGVTVSVAATELRQLSDAGANERGPNTPRMVPLINVLQEEFTWLAGRNLRTTLMSCWPQRDAC